MYKYLVLILLDHFCDKTWVYIRFMQNCSWCRSSSLASEIMASESWIRLLC